MQSYQNCTAPMPDHQLHAAVVEHAMRMLKSSILQFRTGIQVMKGQGEYNFVTKEGVVQRSSEISWTQVETGSVVT